MALRQRLLRDIAELQIKPYPNIKLVQQDDITKACLILNPNDRQALHLTVNFGAQYPLKPPTISMQSRIDHPNILGSYVCASILNTQEGYTPAYTMKGIAIQLLSFFSSDKLEQDYGGTYSLKESRNPDGTYYMFAPGHICAKCGFDRQDEIVPRQQARDSVPSGMALPSRAPPRRRGKKSKSPVPSETQPENAPESQDTVMAIGASLSGLAVDDPDKIKLELTAMPDEILINICNYLEVEELAPFAQAWNRIGNENGIVTKYNIIRNRELICFCFKQAFEVSKLGFGVHVAFKGRQGTLESEFDCLSLEAFRNHDIRTSVQGLPFEHWIPLAISRKHYASIRDLVSPRLKELGQAARLTSDAPQNVLYSFMNDIVVNLSSSVSGMSDRSSLSRASEKAIESYYQLFHLLLCIATEQPQIVRDINRQVHGVLSGRTHKNEIPNLGHLLITILLSDADMTEDLLMAIIRETVVRNVVWMLDKKGANKPELAYMEAAGVVSMYRLEQTFTASLTSYRLLMFLNLFRQTINRGSGTAKKPIARLRDELFDSHGAPPRGTAARLANDIRALQQVNSFPKFLQIMGVKAPSASQFTTFLRDCVESSMEKRYSIWGVTQARALGLRQQVDPGVVVREKKDEKKEWFGNATFETGFFPGRGGGGGGRGGAGSRGGWRGGRGRGRGY